MDNSSDKESDDIKLLGYKDFLQHGVGAGEGRSSKLKRRYLEIGLATEADKEQHVAEPAQVVHTYELDGLYCFPFTGIIVNVVKEQNSVIDVGSKDYWLKKFSKYSTSEVEIIWDEQKQTAQVMLTFDNTLSGFKSAMEFDKSFKSDHQSKKEWIARKGCVGPNIYAWLARGHDYISEGPVTDALRKNAELTDFVQEVEVQQVSKDNNLDDQQTKYETTLVMRSAPLEEPRNVQCRGRKYFKRSLEEYEILTISFEKGRKELDSWVEESDKRKSEMEHVRQILDESKKKSDDLNQFLQTLVVPKKKADESALKADEKLKREKEEALKIFELEKLDLNQKMQMEFEKLTRSLEAKKHLADEDNVANHEKIKELHECLKDKTEEMESVESLNKTLIAKERKSSDELQEAREELIHGLSDVFYGRTNIGIKRMGEIDVKVFSDSSKERFPSEEYQIRALEWCSRLQEKLNNPEWYPMKVVMKDENPQEVIDEDDEFFRELKEEWGSEIYDAARTAFMELNEYNPSGRYVVPELWNFKENKKASLKDVIAYILKKLKNYKRRRT